MPFEQALTARRFDSVMVMEFNSIQAIKNCVKAGLGMTVIPGIAVQNEIQAGELVPLPWEDDLEVAVFMIWHQDRWIPPILDAFLDTARAVVTNI